MKQKIKDLLLVLQTIILIAILVEVSILLFNSNISFVQQSKKPPRRTAQKNPRKVKVNLNALTKSSHYMGNKNAKVTLVKFNSFSCGYCRRAKDTILKLSKMYPNQLKIVYKHFNRGRSDQRSSQAIECAGEQNKFWKMYSSLFMHRDVNVAAKAIQLNLNKFHKCLKSQKYSTKTIKDSNDARKLNIRGTPAFIINDTLLYGFRPGKLEALVKEAMNSH